MVAGAIRNCSWEYSDTRQNLTTDKVIEFVKNKQEFTRLDIENEFNISTGRAYWHVKNLLDKKVIINTDKKLNLLDKGKVYAIYNSV